jgi:predicted dehydrogenase
MAPLRLAVIGVGHLGKEHARILAGLPDVELVGVADVVATQVEAVALRCGTRAYPDHRPLLDQVDAAVIVVPTSHHHAVASEFLRRGVPVLVEKPLTPDLGQAEELHELSLRHGALLQVGHIERFNPAFEALQSRPLQPKYITCERVGPYSGRSTDIGVVLDLMIHDIDLVQALVGSEARSAEAMGLSILGGHEDMATARITFANGCVVDLTASRIAPAPKRCMRLWGAEGFATVDFAARRLTLMQPSESLCQHRSGDRSFDRATLATLKQDLLGRHLQTLELDCSGGDQLTRELQEFIDCVRTGARPRASGSEGRDAVALATRILTSIEEHSWDGSANGDKGPHGLTARACLLFRAAISQAAA